MSPRGARRARVIAAGYWLAISIGIALGGRSDDGGYLLGAVVLLVLLSSAEVGGVWVILDPDEPTRIWKRATFGLLLYLPLAVFAVLLWRANGAAYVLAHTVGIVLLTGFLGFVALIGGALALWSASVSRAAFYEGKSVKPSSTDAAGGD